MDRLKSVCFQAGTCPGGSDPFIRWTYDGVGNRLTETRPSGTTSYTYNAADELTQAGSTSFTYDQNGNELSAGSRTFAYDLANRLKTTTLGNTTTTYLYDGDGKRLQASTGPQANKTTNFLWDVNQGLPQLALERDGNNNPIRRYTFGARRISQTAGNNTSYFLHDGLGSVANLTSSSGATQWTWSYEPFGSIRTEQKAQGNQPDNFLKFTGGYLDPTGLYHLRARQYDPASGRFLTRDPMPMGRGTPLMSAYAYVTNRPTYFVDPTGMIGLPPCGICDALEAGAEAIGGAASSVGREVGQFVVEHRNEIIAGAAVIACVTTAAGCTIATYVLLANTGINVALAGARHDWGCVAGEATGIVAAQGVTTLGVRMIVSQRAAMSRTTRNRGKTFRYDMRLSGAQVRSLKRRGGGVVEGLASLGDLCGASTTAPGSAMAADVDFGVGINGK